MLQNNETWTECTCGCIFDARLNGTVCPQCGRIVTLRKSITMLVVLLIIVIVLLFMQGCTSLKYYHRRRTNHVVQEIQQYQYSIPAKNDIRMWRNWDRRPHNHWPFRFLD